MASLKEWNEAFASYFLKSSSKQILFNVTQDVIATIHRSEGFEKSSEDSIKDFLMCLCNEETGYGDEIDNNFECKTTEKRTNGWPVKPENIFWNAYKLRWMFQSGNRESVDRENQYFKFPNYVPPWTSHLALTILAASMNVGSQPGNARYPMISDLFKEKMDISNEDALRLNKRIEREYTTKFFGRNSIYSSGYYWRAPRIVKYFYEDEEEWRSPWFTLYHWADVQSIYPGRFRKVDGWISDPVTVHSRFRDEDRNAMLEALSSLSPGILPSIHALDQVIIQNKSQFRTTNTKSISDAKLVALREYAIGLWENNQSEIRSYSTSHGTVSPHVLTSDVTEVSEFQVMPYIYIDFGEENITKRVKTFLPRLHHISGPLPQEGQIITIGEHKFQFYNPKYATSGIPLTLDGDLQLIRSDEVIENLEHESLSRIYSFKASIEVYTASQSHAILTQDQHGMHEWLPDDEVSQGLRIVKNMSSGYTDELLSGICGFSIGLDYTYERPMKKQVREIGRTKLKLDGGSKISGGTDRRYHFDSPPHLVLTRGHASDVIFKKINPNEGEEGNYFLEEEPIPVQYKGKTIWKLSLNDDIFPDDSNSSVVKILYNLSTEEAITEISFTVVKGVDHWQLHPTAILDSNNKNIESEFDESIFTNLDSCSPISEEERAAKEAEVKAKAEEEKTAAVAEVKANDEKEKTAAVAEVNAKAEEQKAVDEAEAMAEQEKAAEEAEAMAEEEKSVKETEEKPPITISEEKPKEIAMSNRKSTTTQRPVYDDSRCSSCGIPLVERKSTIFPCPGCDLSIGRCPRCRSNGAKYHCFGCDYIGP